VESIARRKAMTESATLKLQEAFKIALGFDAKVPLAVERYVEKASKNYPNSFQGCNGSSGKMLRFFIKRTFTIVN
jgi:hypothetical protein